MNTYKRVLYFSTKGILDAQWSYKQRRTRMKATFVSVWDGGVRIETPCTVDESGEITTSSVDAGDVELLDREFVETDDGDEIKVCPNCHSFIMKDALVDVEVCSNPECE
jgi:hypothetical protein